MPSDLERAISAARRDISREESPVRRALRDAYKDAVNELQGNLDLVTRQIRDARAMGVEVNPDWLRRQTRYRTLMAQAEYEFRRFSRDGFRIVEGGELRAVSGGAQHAWEMAEAVGADVSFLANINKPAVERTAAAMQRGPLREVLDGYGTNAAQVIEDALMQGVIQGTGPREVVRDIRRQLLKGSTTARLDALVRTEMMRGFRGSLFDQFEGMGLEQWRWVAAHSERTCLACLARSGRVYSMKNPFLAAHVQCRCIPSPVVDSYTPESGPEWYARQDADRQRRMMPSADAFNAYKAGEIQLRDFVGTRRSRRWGPSIYERSGRQVLAGRRGGGVLPDAPTAIEQAEAVIRTGKTETAIIFDTEGNEIFRKQGGKRSVAFQQSDLDRMQGAVLTHNHPGSHRYADFFSPEDIVLVRAGGLQEMRAVSSGYTNVIRRTPDTLPNASASFLKTDVSRITGQVKRELQAEAQAGTITYEQANATYYDEVARRLAKHWRLDYERIPAK